MKSKKNINIEIGTNIKREREKAGYTQEQFSELIGLGAKSLSAIERGAVGISLTSLQRICTVLAVSSDALIFGDAPKRDVGELSEKLARLSPSQYAIASAVLSNLLSAFALNESEQ